MAKARYMAPSREFTSFTKEGRPLGERELAQKHLGRQTRTEITKFGGGKKSPATARTTPVAARELRDDLRKGLGREGPPIKQREIDEVRRSLGPRGVQAAKDAQAIHEKLPGRVATALEHGISDKTLGNLERAGKVPRMVEIMVPMLKKRITGARAGRITKNMAKALGKGLLSPPAAAEGLALDVADDVQKREYVTSARRQRRQAGPVKRPITRY